MLYAECSPQDYDKEHTDRSHFYLLHIFSLPLFCCCGAPAQGGFLCLILLLSLHHLDSKTGFRSEKQVLASCDFCSPVKDKTSLELVVNVRGICRRPASYHITSACHLCCLILLLLLIHLSVAAQWACEVQHRALEEGKEYREWPGMATRKTLLWALQFVVMGNISVLKFDFSFRRRSWAEVTAAGFKGNGQGGKYLARLWFLHSSPWHLLCLSQYSSGRAWGRRNSCTVALPGLWPETVLPLLKEKHERVFVGTGFSKLLLVPPVPWATLKPEGRGATNTTYPLLSASTQYRLFFQNLLLGEKKILMKSPCICIQR